MRPKLLQVVSCEQVAAATVIHDRYMPQWAASDRALDYLAKGLPGFGDSAALVKAAAVDRLYYARHEHLVESAHRIAGVMLAPPADPIALVEAIAPLDHDAGTSCYWSFTSKFVHFFVALEGTPIFDEWAVRTLRHHFGRLTWVGRTVYRAFAEYALALRESTGPCCSVRGLDRYLWLSGMLRGWHANRRVPISREVRSVFESPDPEVQREAQRLLG